jgi:hypothetical protein
MTRTPDARSRANRRNGTTALGRVLAIAAGCALTPGPAGTTIATTYSWLFPAAVCFVVGDVIFCRRTAHWLLNPARHRLLCHEIRHTDQYARFGPLFFPLYVAAAAWSYALTGDVGARNHFERGAGLREGGYPDRPLRPMLRQIRRVANIT